MITEERKREIKSETYLKYAPEVAELDKLYNSGMLDGEIDVRMNEIIKKAKAEAEEIIRREEAESLSEN